MGTRDFNKYLMFSDSINFKYAWLEESAPRDVVDEQVLDVVDEQVLDVEEERVGDKIVI